MTDIEIPYEKDRKAGYRFFEILPGSLSWFFLFLPALLSFINVKLAVAFILGYLLIYFTRTMAVDIRALAGYKTMKEYMRLDWIGLLADIEAGAVSELAITRPKWHIDNLGRLHHRKSSVRPTARSRWLI